MEAGLQGQSFGSQPSQKSGPNNFMHPLLEHASGVLLEEHSNALL